MSDSLRNLTRRLPTAGFHLAMLAGWAGIVVMSVDYFTGVPRPFIIEKLPIPHLDAWLVALKAHVLAASFSLPACLLLLSARLRARFLRAHRWLGRVTAVVVLLALVPTGFVLALTARGGAPGTAGFMLSGVIVAVAMVHGVARARAHDHAGHRRAMRHVVAQLSVAVTSRAMLAGLGLMGVHGDGAYLAALWIPVLGSALVVEAMEPRPLASPATMRWARLSLASLTAALIVPGIVASSTKAIAPELAQGVAEGIVRRGVVQPITQYWQKFGSFSRAPAPKEMRARFLDRAPVRDASGAPFLRFALDTRYGDGDGEEGWQRDVYAGCVYPETGAIYVGWTGDENRLFLPPMLYGGPRKSAPAGACVPE